MSLKKKITSFTLCGALILGNLTFAFADGADVVTIGANLNAQQRQIVLDYFGVKENEVVIIEVNNQEERKYLTGIATEAQLGKQTYSCSYVQPTEPGNGLHVKVSNLTYLNSSMLSSVLVSLGIYDANVVAMSPVGPMSGTGALTGIMKAFESASGEELDESKKEIASEELVITGDMGADIGQDKATGIINDIKTEIIKNDTSDVTQIADTINNVVNNYNVTLSEEQINRIISLMEEISKQNYNYKEMKSSLKYVSNLVEDNLDALGEGINKGFFVEIIDNAKGFFEDLFSKNKDLGIIESTNDLLLGDNAIIDATDKNAINLPSSEEVEGFLVRAWNTISDLLDELFEKFKGTPDTPESQEILFEGDSNGDFQIEEEAQINVDSNKTTLEDEGEDSMVENEESQSEQVSVDNNLEENDSNDVDLNLEN